MARLQSSLERNEAVKQQLQYQLELEQSVDRQKEAGWLADRQTREAEERGREREMKGKKSQFEEHILFVLIFRY